MFRIGVLSRLIQLCLLSVLSGGCASGGGRPSLAILQDDATGVLYVNTDNIWAEFTRDDVVLGRGWSVVGTMTDLDPRYEIALGLLRKSGADKVPLEKVDELSYQAVPNPPLAAASSRNPLLGRWVVYSIGKQVFPEAQRSVWTFGDESILVGYGRGEGVTSKLDYSLAVEDGVDVIRFTGDGKSYPATWFSIDNGELRIGSKAPKDRVNDDGVALLKPAPPRGGGSIN